jgi:CRISPR system Cascade subunit CasB
VSTSAASQETPDEPPLRFAALGTATEFSEITHYARMLIRQLRSATRVIPLDYGRLAGQLFDLQFPGFADGVKLAWGREFTRGQPANAAGDDSPKPTSPSPTSIDQKDN